YLGVDAGRRNHLRLPRRHETGRMYIPLLWREERATGPGLVPVPRARPAPVALLSDGDLGTEVISRPGFGGPMQGQLLDMLARGLAPQEDAAVILADGQVPDATLGRLADPRLDLFGEG